MPTRTGRGASGGPLETDARRLGKDSDPVPAPAAAVAASPAAAVLQGGVRVLPLSVDSGSTALVGGPGGSQAEGIETVSAPAVSAPVEAVAARPVAADGELAAVLDRNPGSDPLPPVETALSWTVAAALRREGGRKPASARAPMTASGDVLGGDVPPASAVSISTASLARNLNSTAAQTPADPIAVILEGVQAVLAGIVGVINQVIGQIVAAVNGIVTAIGYLFVPAAAPVLGTPTVGVPDSTTGAVTGMAVATDANDDPLIFSGSGPTQRGSVVVNADGSFTYTPTALARFIAASTNTDAAYRSDTFIVTVRDERGGVAQGSITVPVTPASPSPIAIKGKPVYRGVVTADGVVYQTSTEFNRVTSRNETYVTRVLADGSTTTFTQPGQTSAGMAVGQSGTVYQVSWIEDYSSDSLQYITTLRAIRADGSIQDYTLPGSPAGRPIVAPNGTIYQSATASGPNGSITATLAITPDGSATTRQQPGLIESGQTRSLNDGAVYVLTMDGVDTHVSVFHADGGFSSYLLSKDVFPPNVTEGYFSPLIATPAGVYFSLYGLEPVESGRQVRLAIVRIEADGSSSSFTAPDDWAWPGSVGSDGTLYWTTGKIRGSANGQDSTSVTSIRPDGSTRTTSWAGAPGGSVLVAPNGLAYQLSSTSVDVGGPATTVTVTALRPDGVEVAKYTQSGAPFNTPFLLADGGVGQFISSVSDGKDTTTLLRILPDGRALTYTQLGGPGGVYPDAVSGDGLYLITALANDPSTIVGRYLPDGSTRQVTVPGQLLGDPVVGFDGTTYLTSYTWAGGDTGFLTTIREDGTRKQYQLNGIPAGPVVIGAGGIVYQVTPTDLWIVEAESLMA